MSPYDDASTITGELQSSRKVTYRDVLSKRQNHTLTLLLILNVLIGAMFIAWLVFLPKVVDTATMLSEVLIVTAVTLMVIIEAIRIAQAIVLWFFASRAKDPVPMHPRVRYRTAVLTTIVPNKEPLEMVLRTLRAMKNLNHEGIMDVWLLDEGNDPMVRAQCKAIGVRHFSRKGMPGYNQPKGAHKAKTKHGNHNAWRSEYEDYYEIVAQMDPDHVPHADFLLRSVGYFTDPDVAFVVAPQVYGNIAENWIARGAAFLAYVFHGVIQRGGNGMGAPLLIGTNHLYRVSAFKQIGGYQDSIIEDHLTSMVVFSSKNPSSGEYWKGVYTPDILAVGEGPTSFTDFFNQQKRWAFGIWEIATTHSRKLFPKMKPSQRLSFLLLQQFYPSVAISWVLSISLTALYMMSGMTTGLPLYQWAILWSASAASSLLIFFWLRRFNLVEHERKDWGLKGMTLMLVTIPVYVSAAFTYLFTRKLTYAVTAKGKLASPDGMHTYLPHLFWAGLAVALMALGFFGLGSTYPVYIFWLSVVITICLTPVAVQLITRTNDWSRELLFARAPRNMAIEEPLLTIVEKDVA